MHCAFRANQQPFDLQGTEDRLLLRPYYTVDQVLFLARPVEFTWHDRSAAQRALLDRVQLPWLARSKSASLRWQATGPFAPVKDAVPVGLLTECVIPQ